MSLLSLIILLTHMDQARICVITSDLIYSAHISPAVVAAEICQCISGLPVPQAGQLTLMLQTSRTGLNGSYENYEAIEQYKQLYVFS